MPLTRHQALVAFLGLAAIWLLTHRYHGIHHDALFYAVQALAHDAPERFAQDLFFAFGSQGDFTLFTPLQAWLSRRLGLEQAAFVLLIGAQCVWILAAVLIARRWVHGPHLVVALALLFALPRQYGANAAFHYAESFLTARVWAEGLVLAGVAATLQARQLLAALAMLTAFMVHPIIALPGVLFLAALHTVSWWRWTLLLGLVVLAASFALPAMDEPWLEMVRIRAPYVFIDLAHWQEWVEPFAWIGILSAAASGMPSARKPLLALALMGSAGIALAAIGTLTKAALIVQAQPWRCLWLLKVCGLPALVAVFMQRWHRSSADRWLLAGLAAAALTANTLGGAVALLLAPLAAALWRRDAVPVLPRWLAPAGTIALLAVLLETIVAMLQQAGILLERLRGGSGHDPRWPAGDPASLFDSPLALLLPLVAALLVRAAGRRAAVALAAATLCLAGAAYGWYRADDPLQKLLFTPAGGRPFDREIPPAATVYWEDNFLYSWFLLGQGNYASFQQSVGVVFSPQAAAEARRRLARIAAFGASDSDIAPDGRPLPAGRPRLHRLPQPGDLAELCRDPILHSVILRQPLGATRRPQWADPLGNGIWYLHRCDAPS